MYSQPRAVAALMVTLMWVTACSEPEGCTLTFAFGIEVEVRDASTDESIAGRVHGVITDGAFEDSLRAPGGDPAAATTLLGAGERAGIYAVHLEGVGYEPWDTTNVHVTRDACHVHPVTFIARLEPVS
jgi:hypothetical protein